MKPGLTVLARTRNKEDHGRVASVHLATRLPIRRESVMRGRHAAGPEYAERLNGSELACHRMRVVLETIAGTKRVTEACAELDICQQRFEAIRQEALQAGVAALELRPAGRPRKDTETSDGEKAQLRERVAELEAQLQAVLIRAELAVTLPRLGGETGKKC
jgi:helix-turn-helix protein